MNKHHVTPASFYTLKFYAAKTSKYDSGTEHEYEWFKKNKSLKAISVYFSSIKAPVDNEQYEKVLAFKERILNSGLLGFFDSDISLRSQAENRLSEIANEKREAFLASSRKVLQTEDFQKDENKIQLLEKTRLELWFEFVEFKIFQGKKYYADPTFTYKNFIQYFDQVHNGLKTAIKDKTKFYPFLNFIGPDYSRIKNYGTWEEDHINLQYLQRLIKIILDGLKAFCR